MAVCLLWVVEAVFEVVEDGERERASHLAYLRGLDAALGGEGVRCAFLVGVARPYRVEYGGGVWGFVELTDLVLFVRHVEVGGCDTVRECARAFGGVSMLHPCFGA